MLRSFQLVALLVLGACTTSTSDVSPAQYYRPAGAGPQWKITGDLQSEYTEDMFGTTVQRTLHVYIDGERVVTGQLSPMATGELSGQYKGLPVDTVCTSEQKTPTWIDVRCMVLVDNERAATLTF